MKNLSFLLLCMSSCLIFLTLGCDETQLQTPSLSGDAKVDLRVDDCEDCPNMDDCCCVLTITSGSGSFRLCGTTDGDATACSIPDPGVTCFDIDGAQHSSFSLNSMSNPHEIFCMAQNMGFEVRQTTTGLNTFTITCQVGELNPQSVNFTIDGLDKKYFEVNGDCEVSECE